MLGLLATVGLMLPDMGTSSNDEVDGLEDDTQDQADYEAKRFEYGDILDGMYGESLPTLDEAIQNSHAQSDMTETTRGAPEIVLCQPHSDLAADNDPTSPAAAQFQIDEFDADRDMIELEGFGDLCGDPDAVSVRGTADGTGSLVYLYDMPLVQVNGCTDLDVSKVILAA